MEPTFTRLHACWVCGARRLTPIHQTRFDLRAYARQDPELAAYTGCRVWIQRCRRCGFAQPEALPALPGYFGRMYDQRWSHDWIEREFRSEAKRVIFGDVLRQLACRVRSSRRRLLDVGAHVGRFVRLAQQSGWEVEGIELNPRTAAFAASRTGAAIHRTSAERISLHGRTYDAVTLIDVLEHIPDPVGMLVAANRLLAPGGWLAVKVPCGPSQLLKERVRACLKRRYKVSLAANLVHVNHFSPGSLELALRRADYSQIAVSVAAPELSDAPAAFAWGRGSDWGRLALYSLGRVIPGGVHLPLAFNLQAYARAR